MTELAAKEQTSFISAHSEGGPASDKHVLNWGKGQEVRDQVHANNNILCRLLLPVNYNSAHKLFTLMRQRQTGTKRFWHLNTGFSMLDVKKNPDILKPPCGDYLLSSGTAVEQTCTIYHQIAPHWTNDFSLFNFASFSPDALLELLHVWPSNNTNHQILEKPWFYLSLN